MYTPNHEHAHALLLLPRPGHAGDCVVASQRRLKIKAICVQAPKPTNTIQALLSIALDRSRIRGGQMRVESQTFHSSRTSRVRLCGARHRHHTSPGCAIPILARTPYSHSPHLRAIVAPSQPFRTTIRLPPCCCPHGSDEIAAPPAGSQDHQTPLPEKPGA